jgi:hypothetical protein
VPSELLRVAVIPARLAADVAEREHYLHRRPRISFAFGLLCDDDLAGIATFGTPASHELTKGACPSDSGLVLEFNRLWVDDALPRNTESWFTARCLRQLPPRVIVSYADTARGHLGHVYRAMGFRYAGWTDMERRTARLDYVPADPAVHTRDAYRNGYARKVRRRPKVRYWTTTGNRAERRRLALLCGWPSMDWAADPPPTEHRKYEYHGVSQPAYRGQPMNFSS